MESVSKSYSLELLHQYSGLWLPHAIPLPYSIYFQLSGNRCDIQMFLEDISLPHVKSCHYIYIHAYIYIETHVHVSNLSIYRHMQTKFIRS